jgi:hypothetical protein
VLRFQASPLAAARCIHVASATMARREVDARHDADERARPDFLGVHATVRGTDDFDLR